MAEREWAMVDTFVELAGALAGDDDVMSSWRCSSHAVERSSG